MGQLCSFSCVVGGCEAGHQGGRLDGIYGTSKISFLLLLPLPSRMRDDCTLATLLCSFERYRDLVFTFLGVQELWRLATVDFTCLTAVHHCLVVRWEERTASCYNHQSQPLPLFPLHVLECISGAEEGLIATLLVSTGEVFLTRYVRKGDSAPSPLLSRAVQQRCSALSSGGAHGSLVAIVDEVTLLTWQWDETGQVVHTEPWVQCSGGESKDGKRAHASRSLGWETRDGAAPQVLDPVGDNNMESWDARIAALQGIVKERRAQRDQARAALHEAERDEEQHAAQAAARLLEKDKVISAQVVNTAQMAVEWIKALTRTLDETIRLEKHAKEDLEDALCEMRSFRKDMWIAFMTCSFDGTSLMADTAEQVEMLLQQVAQLVRSDVMGSGLGLLDFNQLFVAWIAGKSEQLAGHCVGLSPLSSYWL